IQENVTSIYLRAILKRVRTTDHFKHLNYRYRIEENSFMEITIEFLYFTMNYREMQKDRGELYQNLDI
ncbi:hypothetical protein ACQP3D_29540, partial [Escherichia coli]